jgi:hypothetical protein
LESGAPIVAHWRIFIGCCFGRPKLLIQYQLININKLLSGDEQGPTREAVVLLSEIKTLRIQRNERADQKKLKKNW